jgi:hypothetical protein
LICRSWSGLALLLVAGRGTALAAGAAAAAPGAPALAPDPSTAAPAEPAAVVPAPVPPQVTPRWDYAFIPVVFYAPETSLGLGGGVILYDNAPTPSDRPRRDDSIAVLLEGTLKKQFVVNLSGVKFWDAARYQLTEDGVVSRFPSYFWGVGNDTADAAQDYFSQTNTGSRTSLGVRVAEEIYAGVGVSAGWYDIVGYAPGGAVASYVAAHPARGSTLGAGPFIRRDTRDDALGPHRGSFSSLTATFFRDGLGSCCSYANVELLHRAFVPIGSWSVLAIEAYGDYVPGDVPLGELPALGGSSRLRGYFQGRFRDHLYLTGQVEWRIHVAGRFSVAPFAAVGNVFPSFSAVSFDRTKYAGGGAVRFSLKKERELNVHIDVAKSPISSGIYLNLGEAF